MTRREPFYKRSHRAWYVQFDGKYVRLLTGPDDAQTKDAANVLYEEMKLARRKAERFVTPGEPVPSLLGTLLASGFKGKSDQTRSWYADKLTPFVDHLGREFTATEVKPFQIDERITARPPLRAARGVSGR